MTRRPGFHENLDREETISVSSDRGFGLVFVMALAVIGGLRVWRGSASGSWWLLAALVLLTVALARPGALRRVNRLWLKLSLLLYRMMSPVALGIIFYGCVTPIGLLMRMFAKDLLHLRFERQVESYWIERRPPGPAPATMRQQF